MMIHATEVRAAMLEIMRAEDPEFDEEMLGQVPLPTFIALLWRAQKGGRQ